MEITEFIHSELENIQNSLNGVLDGLSQDEIAWQPKDSCNSIGLILFHTLRSEDFFIQELVRKQPQVWARDSWNVRFSLPEEERSRHYKAERVNAFTVPELENLREYGAAVRTETKEYLDSLRPEEFQRMVVTPRGERTVGGYFSNIVLHAAQHLGEMSYLRGLQLGINK